MDDGLFDLDQARQAMLSQETGHVPIQERQVEQIRNLFDSAGIEDQEDRQAFVESIVKARVLGLRSLSRFQAVQVVEALSARDGASTNPRRSAWDDREEDTWIDRL